MDLGRSCSRAAGSDEARRPRSPGPRRLQLRARHQRLLRAARLGGGRATRARTRGCGRLSRSRRLSRHGLVDAIGKGRARPRRRTAAGDHAARLRRPRRHDRGARHRRRPSAAVPSRPRPGRDRHPPGRRFQRDSSDEAGRCDAGGAPRDRDGRSARRCGRARRPSGRRGRRVGPADQGRGLATGPGRRLGRLLTDRSADRRTRARGRSERRRRRARCRADRSRRC